MFDLPISPTCISEFECPNDQIVTPYFCFFFLESCRVAPSALVADAALAPAVAASEGASLAL
jgi:hypothetical protein